MTETAAVRACPFCLRRGCTGLNEHLRRVGPAERTDWTDMSQRPYRWNAHDGTGEYPISSDLAKVAMQEATP